MDCITIEIDYLFQSDDVDAIELYVNLHCWLRLWKITIFSRQLGFSVSVGFEFQKNEEFSTCSFLKLIFPHATENWKKKTIVIEFFNVDTG